MNISSSTGATVTMGNSQTTTITIDGTVGGGSQDAVLLTKVNATSAGTFDAEGTGKGTGEGLEALNCTITVSSGSIILKGTSPGDGGIILDNTDLLANDAAISITATAGTTSGDALNIRNSSIIGSATTTSVTITATARGGTGESDGMIMAGGSITASGDITLQGTAVANGEGIDLDGGAGTLVITAGGAFSATATAVNDSGALLLTKVSITSGSAGLTLDGQGYGSADGLNITSSSMIAANGPVVLIGETVDGDGIVISSTSTIGDSTTTTVSLTGTATAGSGDNDGLNLTGITIRASGNIEFAGTATDTGEGIEFTNIDLSTPGDVSINGSAFNGFFAFDYDNSIVRSTAGSILITGTSTGSAIGVNLQGESTTTQQDAFEAALDITVQASAINFHASTGTASFTGGRNLVIESIGTTFTSAVSTAFVSFGTDFDTIRIGKSTNTGNVTIGSNGASASGTISISAGTLTVSGDVAAGTSLNLSAGTLNSDAGADLSAPSGISATVTTGGTLSGAIIGSGSLTKLGAGSLTLAGTNTYTGATSINAGTIIATNSAALGTTAGSTTITSGAALDVRANIGTEAITVSGTGISSGGALITGSGTGTVGGAVTLAADSSFGGAGDLTISGAVGGSFAVTKVGAGTVTLSGTNTYTGATQIDAGTVIATNSAALGTTAGSTTITSGACA
ncbi:MAG UNVERIFIED_CONTAM: autotransporter-associated beta strand repeat-containing protein [Planctomycetaceae bacterium]